MGLILFAIALISTSVLTAVYLPLSIAFHLVTLRFKKGTKHVDRYFGKMALSIDQFANVSLQTPLNLLLIKSNLHLFGDEDDTVSYVIAMNQQLNQLTRFGKFWAWFLDFVDKDHLKKALDNKRVRDLEAVIRINNLTQKNNGIST